MNVTIAINIMIGSVSHILDFYPPSGFFTPFCFDIAWIEEVHLIASEEKRSWHLKQKENSSSFEVFLNKFSKGIN